MAARACADGGAAAEEAAAAGLGDGRPLAAGAEAAPSVAAAPSLSRRGGGRCRSCPWAADAPRPSRPRFRPPAAAMSGVVRTLSRCLLPADAPSRGGGPGEPPAAAAAAPQAGEGKERRRDAEREARRRSREIDAMLARERRSVRRLVKILLLGAGESGKSTFLKQMRIIHGREFDQKALLEFRATIYENVLKVGGRVDCR